MPPLGFRGYHGRKPAKRPPRLTLVSPITRQGRRQASTRVVPRGNTYVVRQARSPARSPSQAVPTHQRTPVTPQQVAARQARHQRRVQAHRVRVRAKQASETRAVRRRSQGTVFGQPIGGVGPSRHTVAQLGRKVERIAAKLPVESRLPHFPVLAHYTPKQRQIIQHSFEAHIRRIPKLPGENGSNIVHRLYQQADPATRRQLTDVYGRAYREDVIRQQARYARSQQPQTRSLSLRQQATVGGRLQRAYLSQAKPGRKQNLGDKLGGGAGSFAAILNSGIHPVAGMTLANVGKAASTLGGPVVRDTIQLAANTPGSIYNVAAAGYEAAHGDTHRAKQLFESYKNNDPLALAVQGRFKEAEIAGAQHPVTAALDVVGAKALVGGTIGRVERAAARVPAREGAALEGTRVVERRQFSKDAITRRRQQGVDRLRTKRAQKLRQQADTLDRQGELKKARDMRRKAVDVAPTAVKDSGIRRRVDERNAANEDIRRQLRTKAMHSTRQHRVAASKGGHLVSLVAQNIVKADPKDVRAYVSELDTQFRTGRLSRAEEIANRQTVHELTKAVESKRTDWARIEQAARGFQRDMAPVEKDLIDRGLIDASRAERARLIPYAVRHMGAHHDGERLVDSRGRTLTNDQIRAHMDANLRVSPERLKQIGVTVGGLEKEFERHAQVARKAVRRRDKLGAEAAWSKAQRVRNELDALRQEASGAKAPEPAFLSQAPNARGARNFFMSAIQRHTIPNATRSGEATRAGLFDTHPDTLVEQAARAHGLIAADHGYKGMVDEFALRNPRSDHVMQFETKKQVDAFIRDAHGYGARPLRAVRANPFLGKQKDLQSVLDEANQGATAAGHVNDALPQGMVDAMHSAIKGEDGAGPWVVMHDTAAARFQTHLSQLGPAVGLRGVQRVNQAFRNTVLPLSTKWITGNVVEAGFRTALAHAGVLSYITGRKMFGRLDALAQAGHVDELKALEARVRTVGGGHFSMAERTAVRRSADQFNNSSLRPLSRALGAFSRAPGPKQLGGLWGRYTHAVFGLNTVLERQFQIALAGKYARDFLVPDGQVRTMERAVEQGAKGLRNTNDQVAMGRFIDRAYGKYGKLNPTERLAVSYYTPFIAWSLNAVKFIASVLPKDHPVATGLIASASSASEEWLKQHGLNMWAENAVPGWLQGSIPTGAGFVRAGRYLPFGFYSDPAQSISGLLMPQYASAFLALNGLDWKGQPLKHGNVSEGEKFGTAFEAFFGSTIPVVSQIQQVATKKGPAGQKLARQFDPFYPVQNTQQTSGGSSLDSEIQKSLQPDLQGTELDNEIQKALAP